MAIADILMLQDCYITAISNMTHHGVVEYPSNQLTPSAHLLNSKKKKYFKKMLNSVLIPSLKKVNEQSTRLKNIFQNPNKKKEQSVSLPNLKNSFVFLFKTFLFFCFRDSHRRHHQYVFQEMNV